MHLVEVAGGYQITTRPEFHEWVRRLFHERTTQKLTVQSLETLSVSRTSSRSPPPRSARSAASTPQAC